MVIITDTVLCFVVSYLFLLTDSKPRMDEAGLFHSPLCPQHLELNLYIVGSQKILFKEMNEELTFLAPEKPGPQGGVHMKASQHIKRLSHFLVVSLHKAPIVLLNDYLLSNSTTNT